MADPRSRVLFPLDAAQRQVAQAAYRYLFGVAPALSVTSLMCGAVAPRRSRSRRGGRRPRTSRTHPRTCGRPVAARQPVFRVTPLRYAGRVRSTEAPRRSGPNRRRERPVPDSRVRRSVSIRSQIWLVIAAVVGWTAGAFVYFLAARLIHGPPQSGDSPRSLLCGLLGAFLLVAAARRWLAR